MVRHMELRLFNKAHYLINLASCLYPTILVKINLDNKTIFDHWDIEAYNNDIVPVLEWSKTE